MWGICCERLSTFDSQEQKSVKGDLFSHYVAQLRNLLFELGQLSFSNPTVLSKPIYDSSAGDLIASHCKKLQSPLCKTPHSWCETRLRKLDSSPGDQETGLLLIPFEPKDSVVYLRLCSLPGSEPRALCNGCMKQAVSFDPFYRWGVWDVEKLQFARSHTALKWRNQAFDSKICL